MNSIDIDNLQYLEFFVGYWNKANHIHSWLISNCENSHFSEYFEITKEELEKLKEVCKETKEHYLKKEFNKVEDLMYYYNYDNTNYGEPNFDKWYLGTLDYTIEIVNNILKNKNDMEYYYSYN